MKQPKRAIQCRETKTRNQAQTPQVFSIFFVFPAKCERYLLHTLPTVTKQGMRNTFTRKKTRNNAIFCSYSI